MKTWKKIFTFINFLIHFIIIRCTFYCTTVIYFCHNFFKLNQTYILTGCSDDLKVSVYDMKKVFMTEFHDYICVFCIAEIIINNFIFK